MNDLHQLMSSNQPRAMQANFTGRQLRPGFASDIPPHLRDTAPMPQARKTASGGKMGSVNDLHQLFRAQSKQTTRHLIYQRGSTKGLSRAT